MNVTDVTIRRILNEPDFKAIVSITLDNEIVLHDVRIMQKEKRLYLLYPNNQYKDKKRGVVYPINSEARQKIEQSVLCKYYAAIQRLEKKRN